MPAGFLPFRWYQDDQGVIHAYVAYRGVASQETHYWPLCGLSTQVYEDDEGRLACRTCWERLTVREDIVPPGWEDVA